MNVGIRNLVPADLPRLLVLEGRCFPTPWTRDMYMGELGRYDGVCLGAEVPGDEGALPLLVGAVLAAPIVEVWHVMNMLVDPDVRREGVGGALMDGLLQRTRSTDGAGYTLEVRRGNAAAITLYRRYGFTPHGVRPGYYEDTDEDAVIMWRAPSAAPATWGPLL